MTPGCKQSETRDKFVMVSFNPDCPIPLPIFTVERTETRVEADRIVVSITSLVDMRPIENWARGMAARKRAVSLDFPGGARDGS